MGEHYAASGRKRSAEGAPLDRTCDRAFDGGGNLTAKSDISIGELSRNSDCTVETIRYYERIGLLPKPRRQAGGFRRYGGDDVARLKFIRRARQLGFALEDVRKLLQLAPERSEAACAEAKSLTAAHVANVRAKIADLQAMERILSGAIRDCEAGYSPACRIVALLSGSELG
jgi:MerR family transcriptional regulator, mercuric resistance operon regulatory protein